MEEIKKEAKVLNTPCDSNNTRGTWIWIYEDEDGNKICHWGNKVEQLQNLIETRATKKTTSK